MPNLLVEIGCEEIPARMIKRAAKTLGANLVEHLRHEGLPFSDDAVQIYATPRRLAVTVGGLPESQEDVVSEVVGPPAAAAFNNGQPTSAASAFAKKHGIPVQSLRISKTAKGEYAVATVQKRGKSSAEVARTVIEGELKTFYWEKSMYWRRGAPERFVRPVRWIVALLDKNIVPIDFAGVRADRVSYGHRFLGGEASVKDATSYELALRSQKVLVSPIERAEKIRNAIITFQEEQGFRVRLDMGLLETVTYLTEWPSVIVGNFDKNYLALPEEVLVTVMRDHQKYFAIEDEHGKLAPHFLAVLNTDDDPDGLIRHGNERVLRARFNDAQFFWQTDQKTPLKQRIELLKAVTFQKDLGSYYEKTERVEKLAGKLAEDLSDAGVTLNIQGLADAAWLSKTDLTTELVKEFTELQGVVGGLYARAQGSGEPVAQAIYDHYRPQSMEDAVPRTLEGAVLSIADKADSIAGMFALGLQPTGSKDPFALRRQANGIVRIIAEHKLRIETRQLMLLALEGYHEHPKFKLKGPDFEAAVGTFFRERIEFYLREARGIAYDEVNAVLAIRIDDITDALDRGLALHQVRRSERSKDLEAVCVSFKRIKNILRQAGEKGIEIPERPSELRFGEVGTAETDLWMDGHVKLGAHYQVLLEDRRYEEAITEAASLRPLLDRFFEEVMVMVEDAQIRANRLSLLRVLLGHFSSIADFSEIVTEGKNQN